MKRYNRHIFSIVVIAIFLFMAWASSPPISGEPAENCNFLDQETLKVHEVLVKVLDKENGNNISGASVQLSYYHYQKNKKGDVCEFNVADHKIYEDITAFSGQIDFKIATKFKSNEDYIQVYIYVHDLEYGSKDDFHVLRISTPVRNIVIKMLKPKTS